MKKLILGIFTMMLIGTGCQKIDTEIQTLENVIQGEVSAQDYIKEGKFTDPETGLSFNLPAEEKYYMDMYNPQGTGKIVSYRIQNYSMAEQRLALNENEFYVELSIDEINSSRPGKCENLTSVEIVETKKGTQFMGFPDQSGDSGGERYVFCSEGEGYNYYLQVTENNSEHPIREAIKSSLHI